MRFELSGCSSVRLYRPKFCGVCIDNRCCTPHRTITAHVEFQCPEGDVFIKRMMFIKTCSCHYDCPQDNDIFLASNTRRMFGDYDRDMWWCTRSHKLNCLHFNSSTPQTLTNNLSLGRSDVYFSLNTQRQHSPDYHWFAQRMLQRWSLSSRARGLRSVWKLPAIYQQRWNSQTWNNIFRGMMNN